MKQGSSPQPPSQGTYTGEETNSTTTGAESTTSFYQTLKSGGSLDPIEIDWIWYGTSPSEITLRDGHHRFIAAVLAKKRWITADYSGPVDVIEWLEGKAKKRPAWL